MGLSDEKWREIKITISMYAKLLNRYFCMRRVLYDAQWRDVQSQVVNKDIDDHQT